MHNLIRALSSRSERRGLFATGKKVVVTVKMGKVKTPCGLGEEGGRVLDQRNGEPPYGQAGVRPSQAASVIQL